MGGGEVVVVVVLSISSVNLWVLQVVQKSCLLTHSNKQHTGDE
jgi:hypothetical protein